MKRGAAVARAPFARSGLSITALLALFAASPGVHAQVSTATQAALPAPGEGGFVTGRLGGPVPSLRGPIGTLRVSAADVGPLGSLRLGLAGELASADHFLVVGAQGGGDRNRRAQAGLVLAFTPLRRLEIFGRLWGVENRSRRVCRQAAPTGPETCESEPGRVDPEVTKAFGNLSLGAKVASALARGLSVGGAAAVELRPSVAALGFDTGATSAWLDGLLTWSPPPTRLPLRAHANAGFFLDRSYELSAFASAPPTSKTVSGFAYAAGRSRLRGAVAVEGSLPLSRRGRVVLRPSVEYHVEIVTAGRLAGLEGVACRGAGGACPGGRDQHFMTFGLGAGLPAGLAVTAGLDVSLREVAPDYGPRLAPYTFVLAIGAAADLAAPRLVTRTIETTKTVERPATEGTLVGRVSTPDGAPVEGARIALAGVPGWLLTDVAGAFRCGGLRTGPVDVEITAPRFRTLQTKATITGGEKARVTAALEPQGAVLRGSLRAEGGAGVPGTLHVVDGVPLDLTADPTGAFTAFLPPGEHEIQIVADGFLRTARRVVVADRADQALDVTLHGRPATPSVHLVDDVIELSHPLRFVDQPLADAAALRPEAQQTLDELVDLFLSHPEARRFRVEIPVPTRPSDPAARAQLAESRRHVVADELLRRGLARDQIRVVARTVRPRTSPDTVRVLLEP